MSPCVFDRLATTDLVVSCSGDLRREQLKTINSRRTHSMSLYPLKFKPRYVEKIWGGRKIETVLGKPLPPGKQIGESWELYDFPPGICDDSGKWTSAEISNGPLAGQTLHNIVETYGETLLGDVPAI